MRRKLLQRQGAELRRRAPLNGFLLSHSLYADSLKASSVFLNEFQADLEVRERKCGPEEAVGRGDGDRAGGSSYILVFVNQV